MHWSFVYAWQTTIVKPNQNYMPNLLNFLQGGGEAITTSEVFLFVFLFYIRFVELGE